MIMDPSTSQEPPCSPKLQQSVITWGFLFSIIDTILGVPHVIFNVPDGFLDVIFDVSDGVFGEVEVPDDVFGVFCMVW